MGRVLCVANQKGGVGKTTTAVNLAAGLARSGARTLLVDLDPQCNATSGLGRSPTQSHALVSGQTLHEAVEATDLPDLDLLAGSRRFRDVETLSGNNGHDSVIFERRLMAAANAYDFMLIDCPPSLGQLTKTALAASSEVVMPIQCEYFAMEGLAQMIEVIRGVMERPDRRLEFGGIVLTMYD
ncbi:MAG: ParA family protein, partial [Thermoguttaceae bacterium]